MWDRQRIAHMQEEANLPDIQPVQDIPKCVPNAKDCKGSGVGKGEGVGAPLPEQSMTLSLLHACRRQR